MAGSIGDLTQNFLENVHALLDANLVLSRPENDYTAKMKSGKLNNWQDKFKSLLMDFRGGFGDLISEFRDMVNNRGSANDIDRISNKMYEEPFGKFKNHPSKIKSELDDVGELIGDVKLPRMKNNSYIGRKPRGRSLSSNLFDSKRSDMDEEGTPGKRNFKGRGFFGSREDLNEKRKKNGNRGQSKVDLSPKVQRSLQSINVPNNNNNIRNHRYSNDPSTPQRNRNLNQNQNRSRSPIIFPPEKPINPIIYKKPEVLRVVTPEKNKGNYGPSFANSNKLIPYENNPNTSDKFFNSMTPREKTPQNPSFSNNNTNFQHPVPTFNTIEQPKNNYSNHNNSMFSTPQEPPRFSSHEEQPVRLVEEKPLNIEQVELRQVNYNEPPETEIRDKQTYFTNNSSERIDTPEVSANKMDLNSSGTLLYLGGLTGTSSLNTNIPSIPTSKANITVFQGNRPDKKTSTLYKQQENFITQEPNSNDLVLNDKNMNELKRIPGNYEPGKVIEHFHEYRHSLDDDYMLWRAGDDDLSVVDKVLFKVRYSIRKFWTYQDKSCMPVAACSDRTGSRIMASSMAGPTTHILHFYDENTPQQTSVGGVCDQVVSGFKRSTAMEVSSKGDVVYLAGVGVDPNKPAMLVAVNLNSSFSKISEYSLSDLNYGKIRRVRRIRGYEVLLVGGKKHIAVVEFMNNRFVRLASLPDIHRGEITDITIKNHVMFSKAYNEEGIKVTYLGPRATSAGPTRIPTAQSYESVFNTDGESAKSSKDSPSKGYQEMKRDKIETNIADAEKISLSKSGNNLYVGGAIGLNIFARKSGTTSYSSYKLDKDKSKK